MKRNTTIRITVTAFCVVLNMAGAYVAQMFRIPIYLDSIGTILVAALLGPGLGLTAACLSGLLNGITSDPYAFYFIPSGMITGFAAGILFKFGWFRKWKLPLGVLFLTVPGTLVSSCISAFLFGGVTSSGSSVLVQVLHHMGCGLVASAFIAQIMTDYLDRLVSVVLVCLLTARVKGGVKIQTGKKEAG